ESMKSDADAVYDDVVKFDGAEIEPVVTWGITPAQSVSVGGRVPALADFAADEADTVREAYRYMSLEPGQAIRGMKVDVAFIGSCTNGRLSDFQTVVELLEKKPQRVKAGVRALVVPGSQRLRREMIERGWDRVFTDAGFEFREAGCS